MLLTWTEVGLPPLWLMAHWPATRLIIVIQTTGGAAIGMSPPSFVSISVDASQQTAVDTVTVWTDAVDVRMAGRVPLVILKCVSRVDPMVSALPMAVSVMLDGEGRTVAKSASQVSMVTAAIRPVPVIMVVPVTPFMDAARALLVSRVTPVNNCVLWVSSVHPALRNVTVKTCVHVTRKLEAVMPL